MESSKPLEIAGIILGVLGALSFLLTYIRAAINKSNRDIDRNTITSLKDSNAALTEDRDMWKEKANKLEGQNKVLQETVTGAPLIAELTRQVAKQHAATAKWQTQTTTLQTSMIREFKKFIEAYDKDGTR